MTQKTEAMVLRDAAAILERDGWVQGALHKHGGGHCLMGSVHAALGFLRMEPLADEEPGSTGALLFRCSRRLGGLLPDIPYLPEWNDAPERTLEEVLALLHAAADDAAREQLALVPAREAVEV